MPELRGRKRAVLASALLSWALSTLSACVTIYEPGNALRKPAVINPTLANFKGTKIFVRCKQPKRPDENILDRVIPNPLNNDGDTLCQKVRTLFANQGADVETATVRGDPSEAQPSEGRPDLIVDLQTRVVKNEENAFLGVANCFTCTLVPTRQELRFAELITVRDGDGALLKSEEFTSRFVTYSGCGVWSVNYLIDVFFRDDDNDLIGDTPMDPNGLSVRDHSKDFYGQLSQLAWNARVRSRLLHGEPLRTPTPAPTTAAAPTAPTPTPAASMSTPTPPAPAPTSTPLPSTPEQMPAPAAASTPTVSDTDYGY